jgi:hypothetical protein
MKHIRSTSLVVVTLLALGTLAEAKITTVALYHCGEDGDVPTNSLLAAVGADLTIGSGDFYKGLPVLVTNTTSVPGSTRYLRTSRTAWFAPYAYLDGQLYNWGMAAWVQLPATPLSGSTYNEDNLWFMSNGGWDSGLGIRYGKPTCSWADGQGSVFAAVASNLWDTWVHVAVVYNGNNKKQVYVNGEQVGADQASNASWDTSGLMRVFQVGSWNANNYNGRYVRPAIDEIRVFSFLEGEFKIEDLFPPVREGGVVLLIQ